MQLDPQSCYRAVRSRDPRYDGRFFVAVKTTRIYCRPICPAKPALFKNVLFYRTSAEAAEQGFRPCRRCRPELAAGSPLWSGTSSTVSRALKLIDEGYLGEHPVSELARTLGLGERHLRSLFIEHVGVAPKSLEMTKRLDFARSLIDTTDLSMSDIALTSGFSSIRRFNDAMKKRYRVSPTELRKGRVNGAAPHGLGTDCYVTHLAYRPPIDWDWMFGYLRARALKGIEVVDGACYARSFSLPAGRGWLRVAPEPDDHRVRVEVSVSDARCLMSVIRRVRSVLDLNADPLAISEGLAGDATMARLVKRFPGTRLPGCWDGHEAAVRTIIGQLISIKAAASITGRLIEAYGEPLASPVVDAPTHVFPTPEALASADVESSGLTRAKARTLRLLSGKVLHGEISFEGIIDFAELRQQLLELPGIGPWSADYLTLKLSDPDAFPRSDLVIGKGLDRLDADPDAWRPWRGYATHYLWRWYAEQSEATS